MTDGIFQSLAFGVSSSGSTIVGQGAGSNGVEAFRWTSGTGMVGLGHFSGALVPISAARDVSKDGSVVVGDSFDFNTFEAFVWDEINGMRRVKEVLSNAGVDLTGWEHLQATGVSDDGTVIVGVGTNPDGNSEGWLATIPRVPEPSSLSLAVLTFSGTVALGRKRTTRP